MNTLGDYPPGAANDPRAPWNEPLPETIECDCGQPAEYVKTIPNEFPDGMPFDEHRYYCTECVWNKYDDYKNECIENMEPGDELPGFNEFLTDENIDEL